MKRRPDRPRELHVEPGSPTIRYWELYDPLQPGQQGEEGSALAYPRRWSTKDKKWITVKNDDLRRKVWTVHGHVGRKGQIVTTLTGESGRHEVIEIHKAIYEGVVTQTGGIAGGATGEVLLTGPGETEQVRNPFVDIAKDKPVLVSDADGKHVLWFPGTGETNDRISVRFVLDEDMGATTANQASATVLNAVGEGAPAEFSSITVHDPGDIYTDAIAGCEGVAINFGTVAAPEYLIANCERVAEWAMAALDAQTAMCPADNPTIDPASLLFTEVSTGDARRPPPAGSYLLENFWGHAALANDDILLKRSFNAKIGDPAKWVYDVVEVRKYEVTVPTELRFDFQGSNTLQWRGKKAAIEHCGDSDWQTVLTPVEKSYVTGGSYDAANHQYKLTREKAWVFAWDTQSDHVLHTLVAQGVVIANDINGFNFRYTPMTIYLAEKEAAGTPIVYHTGVDCA